MILHSIYSIFIYGSLYIVEIPFFFQIVVELPREELSEKISVVFERIRVHEFDQKEISRKC